MDAFLSFDEVHTSIPVPTHCCAIIDALSSHSSDWSWSCGLALRYLARCRSWRAICLWHVSRQTYEDLAGSANLAISRAVAHPVSIDLLGRQLFGYGRSILWFVCSDRRRHKRFVGDLGRSRGSRLLGRRSLGEGSVGDGRQIACAAAVAIARSAGIPLHVGIRLPLLR